MHVIKINIINKSANPLPAYATEGSSGLDLRANLDNPVVLKPLQRHLVPTGIYMELPVGYEAQVRPRSGLAVKQGITCLNTPGTVDSDYRGEIKVLLINLSEEEQAIHNNDRIAQMVICRVEKAELVLSGELDITVRGTGGFGHTGVK